MWFKNIRISTSHIIINRIRSQIKVILLYTPYTDKFDSLKLISVKEWLAISSFFDYAA